MSDILSLMGYVQDQGEQGRKRGLAQLVGKAYNAPAEQRQAVLGQIANVDGPTAMDAQKALAAQDDDIHTRLLQQAATVTALYKTNPQMAQAAYQPLLQLAHQAGFGNQVPPQLDDKAAQALDAMVQSAHGGDEMKSLRVGQNGNFWAIRGGQLVDTGTPALPQTAVRDQPGMPFDIIDKRTGGSVYNQQPQPQQAPQLAPNSTYQTPSGIVQIGDVAPEDMAAVQADVQSGGASDAYKLPTRDVSPQGRPPSRPASAPISPYQQQTLDMQRERMRVAQAAAGDAAAARKAAEDVKAEQKGQAAKARQAASAEASNQLVTSIDNLMQSPGFDKLGTVTGSMEIGTPYIRNDAKDANAQLHNIAGQVALATMSRLKALSTQGATGFGSLSGPELTLLQNSIATLKSEDISNDQLRRSLKIIRDTMAKVSGWNPQAAQQAPQTGGWSATRVK
jgi:hypothetical protein